MRPPASGVLVTALRLAVGGGVLRRRPDGFPAFPIPPQAASCRPEPLCPQGPRCPGAGAPASGRCHRRCHRPAAVPAGGAGGSDPGGPRGPGSLRSPLPILRAGCALSAPLLFGLLQHYLWDGSARCGCHVGFMDRRNARWATSASMPRPFASPAFTAPEVDPARSKAMNCLALEQLVDQLFQRHVGAASPEIGHRRLGPVAQ